MLVTSLVVPANLVIPTRVEALDPICQWDLVNTPAINANLIFDICSPSEINKLVVGSDGKTIWAVDVASVARPAPTPLGITGRVYKSNNGGISWGKEQKNASNYFSPTVGMGHLYRDIFNANQPTWPVLTQGKFPVWDIAMAPDDVNFVVAVVTDNLTLPGVDRPRHVYISQDGGLNWQNTNFSAIPTLTVGEIISWVDVSMKYGNTRDVLVGTRTDNATAPPILVTGDIYVLKAPSNTPIWTGQMQNNTGASGTFRADIYAAKFSPNYAGDDTIIAVASPATDNVNTFVYIGFRDLASAPPRTNWDNYMPVEIRNPSSPAGCSPGIAQMIQGDVELPSDFSGQSPGQRRVYVSTDANTGDNITNTGIFRIDDQNVYSLMNTTDQFSTTQRRISSISYWGTYSSGKLLAGEVMGYACTATVPTWFSDSPTVCASTCWNPALKPTTGASNNMTCLVNSRGFGNAKVVWSPTFADQGIAYVGTSSDNLTLGGTSTNIMGTWPFGLTNSMAYDESAFGLTRNNGETWNQLSIIDTFITKFTDVAPAPDCSTVYLASTNNLTTAVGCQGFDSVWRSGTNTTVVTPPLPALPLGSYWERVLCRPTATSCNVTKSNHAILRLAPDKADGQVAFWAVGGTNIDAGTTTIGGLTVGPNRTIVMWSPDYGDYWAQITPRVPVQDLAAASSTLIYILGTDGAIQRMPYTGAAWSNAERNSNAEITGHMVLARSDWVLVGDNGMFASLSPFSYSSNQGKTFARVVEPTGNNSARVHVAFDSKFEDNKIIYIGYDDAAGSIYRWAIGSSTDWTDLLFAPSASGSIHRIGYYGLAVAYTRAYGGALYGVHDNVTSITGGVQRTLTPTEGMPKPGIEWDCLNWFAATLVSPAGFPSIGPRFTEEPWSLKLCGYLTINSDTSLFALDNNLYNYSEIAVGLRGPGLGNLWTFTDCMAKKGPALTMANKTLIGCDPVSGRNQEINFTWEQLCIATGWDIEIAKDTAFSQRIFDYVTGDAAAGFYIPPLVTKPAFVFPVAANANAFGAAPPVLMSALECGHTYCWRVQARRCATGQIMRSPWSEVRSFTTKAGLPVSTPYYGLQLLAPDNGCIGCPVKPASFSWSPYKEITKYKFVLAKDAALTQVVVETTTTTTGYEYEGQLDYSANYFWRVMALEPPPSDWSSTFNFQTISSPAPQALPPPAPVTPLWVWIVIAIGAILVIIILVLILRTG